MNDGRRALIGHTGFAGGNLLRQAGFDELFNSANIESIRGRSYEMLVCAGVRAEKWKANQEPEADWAGIRRLIDALQGVAVRRLILISTVDVYADPRGVDENTPLDLGALHPYGKHRGLLEEFAAEQFDALIIRLPGLFGTGLKKNVIFDLLHGNQVDRIHADSVFQFYHLARLWSDLVRALQAGLRRLNLATEPVSVREVAHHALGLDMRSAPPSVPICYDMRTLHAVLFGAEGHYLWGREAVLSELAAFVRDERDRLRRGPAPP